jgi:hypothetical protein
MCGGGEGGLVVAGVKVKAEVMLGGAEAGYDASLPFIMLDEPTTSILP